MHYNKVHVVLKERGLNMLGETFCFSLPLHQRAAFFKDIIWTVQKPPGTKFLSPYCLGHETSLKIQGITVIASCNLTIPFFEMAHVAC
jgi:hypothetical protein